MIRLWDGREVPRLGLGCWAIGGPFFAGDTPLGYGTVDDAESTAAIHCAVDLGIRFFDTADVYGAGHSEEVLGQALEGRDEVVIATKLGNRFDPATKQYGGSIEEGDLRREVLSAVDGSRRRLRRDRLDLVQLHLNTMAIDRAARCSTYSTSSAPPAPSAPMAGAPTIPSGRPPTPSGTASSPCSTA